MKKTIITLLSILLVILLLVAGVIVYIYTPSGSNRIRTYVEKRIQKQTGLPIVFDKFKLSRGHLYFIATLGQEASLGFDGAFDILRQHIDGRYLLRVSKFKYQRYTLRQANLSGHASGTLDDISIDGKGTLLDGPAAYKLKIHDKNPEDIVIQLRKLPIEELLSLSGNPRVIKGELNADILMPSVGKKGSRGKALVQLDRAKFDPILVRKLYSYTLPPDKTSLRGKFKVELDGEKGVFEGKILSDLLSATISNGQLNMSEKTVASDFAIDAKELAPVTNNKLMGPLKLSGVVKHDVLGTRIKAQTGSLGGNIDIDYTESISAKLKDVSLTRLLHMIALPDYAEGKINGKLALDGSKAQKGSYTLKLSDGKFHAKVINGNLGTSLPVNASMIFDSTGKFVDGVLSAKSKFISDLFSLKATKTVFHIKSGRFDTDYLLNIPDPMLLAGKKGKGIPVTISGTASKDKLIHITGNAKGLGKKLLFDYSKNRIKIDGDNIYADRVLASMGQPVAVSGIMDIKMNFSSIEPLSGSISIAAPSLKTYPKEMEKLVGKPLDTTLSVLLSGEAKKGVLYAKSDIKSPMMNISLPKMVYNTKNSTFSSPYHLNIPDLAKVKPLTGVDLKGSFVSSGSIKRSKLLSLDGSSTSLGGELTYSYVGTQADIKLSSVPLPKIMYMVGQPQQLLGAANADLRYNTGTKRGNAHIAIDKFQFKPGKLTTAVKMILQKDLSQIIYDRTTVDAIINGDNIKYRIKAHGKRSDFVIKDGLLNTKKKTNKGSFGLRIDNVDVIGTLKGPIKNPKVAVLPGKMMQSRIKKKVLNKVKKEINKNTNGTVKKIIENLPF